MVTSTAKNPPGSIGRARGRAVDMKAKDLVTPGKADETTPVAALIYSDVNVMDSSEESIAESCTSSVIKETKGATVDWDVVPPRWGNSSGLGILERFDRTLAEVAMLSSEVSRLKPIEVKFSKMASELDTLKRAVPGYLAIRSRYMSVFKRQKLRNNLPQADLDIINDGNVTAHHGDAFGDALVYEKNLRSDVDTYIALYGIPWDRALTYAEDDNTLHVLSCYSTDMTSATGPSVPVQEAFQSFVQSLEDGGWRQHYLKDEHAPETLAYWKFWNVYNSWEKEL